MFRQLTRSIILSIALTIRPDCVMAANIRTVPSNPVLDALVLNQREIVSGSLSQELIDRQGKNLIDSTQKFISDPKNKKWLESDKGKELLKRQGLLTNYIAIKDFLNRCVKKSENNRDLKNRVINAAFSQVTKADATTPCIAVNHQFKSFKDFNNQIMKIVKQSSEENLLSEINQKVLINNMKSMIGLKYKFDPNFMKPGYLTNADLKSLMTSVCVHNTCAKLGSSFYSQIQNEAINYSKTLKASMKRFDKVSAAKTLNESIDRLNKNLDAIKVGKDEGIIFDSANLKNPETKKQFDQYVYSYMQEVSTDAGPLLLTKTMRKKAGEIKSFNEDDTKKESRSNQFKFTKHQHIKAEDISEAVKEANDKMVEAAKDTEQLINKEMFRKTNSRFNPVNSRRNDIDQLVKINPFSIGQVLIAHPEYAGMACDSINRIEKSDNDTKDYDKYFMIGGAILGGALLLTGVGTMVGAYMITGSVTAGIAAGTVGGTIMSATMIAGATSETATAIYFGKKSMDSYQDEKLMEKAIFTNNGDNYSIIEKKEAYVNFKEARMKSMIALASAGFSGVRIERFFELSRFITGPLKLNELKGSTKIMEYLSENQIAAKIFATTKVMGSKGGEMLDEFLVRLAKVSEKVRMQTLEMLKDSKITPEKLKEVFEEALQAAKNCSKA